MGLGKAIAVIGVIVLAACNMAHAVSQGEDCPQQESFDGENHKNDDDTFPQNQGSDDASKPADSKECSQVKYFFNNTGDRVEYLESGATIPKLEFATACAKITTNARGLIPGTIGSYGTVDEPEGISITGYSNSKGVAKNLFVVNGQKFIIQGQFMPNTKYSMCVVYYFKHKYLVTYINNQIVTLIKYKGIDYLPGGGKIIIGQRQRKLGRCFDFPYSGEIEDFMFWGRALSKKEVQDYSSGVCPGDNILTAKRNEVIPHGKFYTYTECQQSSVLLTNNENVTEYVKVSTTLPETDFLTVCAVIKTDSNGMLPGTIISYSTATVTAALLMRGEMLNNLPVQRLIVNGITSVGGGPLPPNADQNFCMMFHGSKGRIILHSNGISRELVGFKTLSGLIPGGGTIIIGQTQKCKDGCFEEGFGYNGSIKNFKIWTRALSKEEIKSVTAGDECPDDSVVDLQNEKKVTV